MKNITIKGSHYTCEDLPYEVMTDDKWDSLGETMPLRDVLDMGWNSVRVDNEYCCNKCCDGSYELDGLEESALNRMITLADEYDEDGDGYPIVYARFEDDANL